MIKSPITIDDAIELLNQLVAADPKAAFELRVQCTEAKR